ncbi:hypothetical protein NUSPORA_00172 [Nucleospora cyclopteri]
MDNNDIIHNNCWMFVFICKYMLKNFYYKHIATYLIYFDLKLFQSVLYRNEVIVFKISNVHLSLFDKSKILVLFSKFFR